MAMEIEVVDLAQFDFWICFPTERAWRLCDFHEYYLWARAECPQCPDGLRFAAVAKPNDPRRTN